MFTVRTRRMAVAGMAALALFTAAGCSGSAEEAADTATATAESATSAATSAAESATGSESSSESESESQTQASLADWDGNWVSLGALAKTDEMKPFAEDAAKEHGETVDEVMAEVEEKRNADFEGMVIGDDKITFVKTLDEVASTDAAEGAEYTFVESKTVKHGEHDINWFIFEGGEGAPYKYVALMPLHGEESLAHFHMRYGDSVDEIIDGEEDWFPTFIAEGSATDEQIAESLFHHDH